MTDPKVFFQTAPSAVDDATVKPNGTKTRLANGVDTFFGKPNGINSLRKLRNHPFDY